MTPQEIRSYVEQIEQEIRSRFEFAPEKRRPRAAAPDFSTPGPLGVIQNLQYVLWYCEELRKTLGEVRAQNWNQVSLTVHSQFALACGLAAAENMLPLDDRLRELLVPPVAQEVQKAA